MQPIAHPSTSLFPYLTPLSIIKLSKKRVGFFCLNKPIIHRTFTLYVAYQDILALACVNRADRANLGTSVV